MHRNFCGNIYTYAQKFSQNVNFTDFAVKTTTVKIKSVKILQFATIGVFAFSSLLTQSIVDCDHRVRYIRIIYAATCCLAKR